MPAGRPIAEWQNPSIYAWLHAAGRAAFAWEWLRRRPEYANGGDRAAQRFGLHRWEAADRDARGACPFWRTDVDPFVLVATARPCAVSSANFDLARLRVSASMIGRIGSERWLFGEALRSLRLDIVDGTLCQGPVLLTVCTARLQAPSLAALARLIALARDGYWRKSLFSVERRAQRWAAVLRVHDALNDGARQRDIADRLFGTAGIPRWRVNAAPWRRRTQRLVEAARRASAAEPAAWLTGVFP